jgi:hypothetical protein
MFILFLESGISFWDSDRTSSAISIETKVRRSAGSEMEASDEDKMTCLAYPSIKATAVPSVFIVFKLTSVILFFFCVRARWKNQYFSSRFVIDSV